MIRNLREIPDHDHRFYEKSQEEVHQIGVANNPPDKGYFLYTTVTAQTVV
jgi:hypothetical protein